MAVPAAPVLKVRNEGTDVLRYKIAAAVATATSYKVYRRPAGSGVLTLVATINAPALTARDASGTPGTVYYFTAKAHNADGDSVASEEVRLFAADPVTEGTPTHAQRHARVDLGRE